jgi:hypothetical protein
MKPLREDVERELGRVSGTDVGRLRELVRAWPAAVGATIARNAWPARVGRDGTLHVNTVDSIWAFELTNRAIEIARRLRVERVRFAPGPLPEPATEGTVVAEHNRRELSAAIVEEGERLAAGIEDENLRKLVARAAAASLARGLADRSV